MVEVFDFPNKGERSKAEFRNTLEQQMRLHGFGESFTSDFLQRADPFMELAAEVLGDLPRQVCKIPHEYADDSEIQRIAAEVAGRVEEYYKAAVLKFYIGVMQQLLSEYME